MAAPRSMTGYGAARADGPRLAVEVEARSVNARSLRLSLRAPSMLNAREADIEALVRKRVRRGTVAVSVRVELKRPEDVVRVRPEAVEGLARSLEALRERGLIEGKLTPDAIATIPGALETGPAEDLRPVDWRVVKSAVEAALDRLDAMRDREAGYLARDLAKALGRMRKALARVRRRVPAVAREAREKLRDRIDALLEPLDTHIDEVTLAREVAVLADRSDVTEETVRLAAHIEEFAAYLARGTEIGRTLEFLTQEMLREVNTIGSKSGDVEITRAVIELKSDVDRLKEQSANLE